MSGFELPDPLDSEGPDIADLLCQDIMARKEIGIKTYGKPLRAFNGRPALWDLLAELLDACHYTRQKILEQERLEASLEELLEIAERRLLDAALERDGVIFAQGVAHGLKQALCAVRGNHPYGEGEVK